MACSAAGGRRRRWLLCVALVVLCVCKSVAFHEVEQREGLLALYTATNGASWRQNSGWAEGSADECSWFGVQCDSHQSVSELHLSNNNLVGTLPGKFFHELPELRSLFLQANVITYTIPPEIGDLHNAAIIWLHENRISGSIPEELGKLSHLQQLYLGNNLLDSSIPSELTALPSLKELRLGDNRLSGTIPADLPNITTLRLFDVHQNRLDGGLPEGLSALSALRDVRVDDNALSGTVPTLPAGPFQRIRLDNNRFTVTAAEADALCASRLLPGALHTCTVLPQGATNGEL